MNHPTTPYLHLNIIFGVEKRSFISKEALFCRPLRNLQHQGADAPFMSHTAMRMTDAGRMVWTPAVVVILRRACILWSMETTLLLKIVPTLHGDLAGIKFTFTTVAALVSALCFAFSFAGVSPAEIVKVPECVDRQNKVPDWQGEEVDQHPDNVAYTVGGDDDEDSG